MPADLSLQITGALFTLVMLLTFLISMRLTAKQNGFVNLNVVGLLLAIVGGVLTLFMPFVFAYVHSVFG